MVTYQASYKLAAPVRSRSLSVSTKSIHTYKWFFNESPWRDISLFNNNNLLNKNFWIGHTKRTLLELRSHGIEEGCTIVYVEMQWNWFYTLCSR